jgi:general secretion pathway protein M
MSAQHRLEVKAAWAQRWASLAPRERAWIGAAVVLSVVALLWWVALAPALAKIRSAQAATPALDAQLQVMRAMAQEANSLKAQRKLSYDESLRALEGSLKTLGAGGTLTVTDSRATIALRAVGGDALVRANARLVPAELRLKKTANAAPQAAAWDGSVMFNLDSR